MAHLHRPAPSFGQIINQFLHSFRCPAVFNSEHFNQIIQLKSLPIPNATLIKGLVMSAACITDKDMRLQYLTQILTPIKDK